MSEGLSNDEMRALVDWRIASAYVAARRPLLRLHLESQEPHHMESDCLWLCDLGDTASKLALLQPRNSAIICEELSRIMGRPMTFDWTSSREAGAKI